jgi:hypothetical protein
MIVNCINSGKIKNLTEGKNYKVIKGVEGLHQDSYIRYAGFWIINDVGIKRYYSSKRFIDKLEWRDKQINKLLND